MPLDRKEKDDDFDIDDVSADLKFGKFQMINVFVTSLAVFLSILSGQVFVFTARNTNYRCMIPECEDNSTAYRSTYLSLIIPTIDGEVNKCERYSYLPNVNESEEDMCSFYAFDYSKTEECKRWIFKERNTLVEEFNIPCQEWKLTLVGTVNGLAHMINYFVSGILADKYGRKKMMVIMAVSASILGTLQSFSNSYWTFVILEFVNLTISSGSFTSAFVLCIELLPNERRLLGSAVLNATCALSNAFVGCLAWYIPYWRYLVLAGNIPSLLTLVAIYAIPESYLWLYSQGRFAECADVIKRAAMMNDVTLSKLSNKFIDNLVVQSKNLNQKCSSSLKQNFDDANPGLTKLIKSKCLMMRLGINCVVWFITLFVYDGLTITSVSLGGSDNIYLNFILVAIIEIPGHLIYFMVADRFGRKWSLVISLALSGMVILLYSCMPASLTFSLLLIYMIGKFIVTVASDIIYIFTSEMFPTSMRNSTLNISSLFGALGISIAPQMPLLSHIFKELPVIVFGATLIIAALFASKLPETVNTDLPETITEAENVSTKNTRKKVQMDVI